MTNTYAINTTRGQEFTVEAELLGMGLHPWVPRRLETRRVKEKPAPIWYDKAYVPKLLFCVIPAVYWRDVFDLKHVHGKPAELSRLDIDGVPAVKNGTIPDRPARYGLKDFKAAVDAEYAEMRRLQRNNEYQCAYTPGQALEMLSGPFSGLSGPFQEVVRRASDDYARLRVALQIFGRETMVDVDPSDVGVVDR